MSDMTFVDMLRLAVAFGVVYIGVHVVFFVLCMVFCAAAEVFTGEAK